MKMKMKYPFKQFDEWSYWPLRAVMDHSKDSEHGWGAAQYLVEIDAPTILPGDQDLAVLDVTHIAPRLELGGGGEILPDGTFKNPGYVIALIGGEGQYALLKQKEGRDHQVLIERVTVRTRFLSE